ncbi:MAG TPA: EpsI family protein [Bacteroidales bacterium]|jgi:EpsI family protein|nr:EpsI family protein [Bacteroidales bacterium]
MNKERQLIILIIILAIPTLFAFAKSDPPKVEKKIKLTEALADIDGYKVVRTSPLEDNIFTFLDLDDYIFRTYEKDGVQITLYIGFYYTADKVSAAHSPLVCFPGQGWTITEPEYGRQMVGDHQINYAQIDATLGNQKELIVYWYQSHDDTVTHVYRNKLNTFYNKIFNDDQQHAFVRISVPLNTISPEFEKNVVNDFMNEFYLDFVGFLNG